VVVHKSFVSLQATEGRTPDHDPGQVGIRFLTIVNIRIARQTVTYRPEQGSSMKLPNNTAIAVALVAVALSVSALIIVIAQHV
jgi:hypothetical protein